MTAMLGARLALCISDIPFDGPVAGVIVGRVDGKLIIDPTVEQKAKSDINFTVAGTASAIMMVEAGADQVPEEEMLDAIMFGHEAIKKLCAFEEEDHQSGWQSQTPHRSLYPGSRDQSGHRRPDWRADGQSHLDRRQIQRQDAIDALKKEILDDYDARQYDTEKNTSRP
jgi:polyribonucleotide nucleotidyltransferase